MKQKKYSESKIKTAQKFLSKYELTFDNLNALQKNVIVNYTSTQKYFALSLFTLIIGSIIFALGAYYYYESSFSIINDVTEKFASVETFDLYEFGKICLERGSLIGLYSLVAFVQFLNVILILLFSKRRGQVFDAFLPALKRTSDDNKTPSN